MTHAEKEGIRYEMFVAYFNTKNTLQFPWHWDYYELTGYDICLLDEMAEVFGIRPSTTGKSRSRLLWEQLHRIHERRNKELGIA